MSFLFPQAPSFQNRYSFEEKGYSTPSSISSNSGDDKIKRNQSALKQQNCPQMTNTTPEINNDYLFQEVKQWFLQKNITPGNPEDIIEKAKMAQRSFANNKIHEKKDETLSTSSGLRERRLKRTLTLMI